MSELSVKFFSEALKRNVRFEMYLPDAGNHEGNRKMKTALGNLLCIGTGANDSAAEIRTISRSCKRNHHNVLLTAAHAVCLSTCYMNHQKKTVHCFRHFSTSHTLSESSPDITIKSILITKINKLLSPIYNF